MPYLNKKEICAELAISPRTVNSRISEMEKSKRYKKTDIIRDGCLLHINWYAFIEWESIRQDWLKGKPLRPFDRKAAEKEIALPLKTAQQRRKAEAQL